MMGPGFANGIADAIIFIPIYAFLLGIVVGGLLVYALT
jgi:hypothetical protein